jgi:hypothetical protein
MDLVEAGAMSRQERRRLARKGAADAISHEVTRIVMNEEGRNHMRAVTEAGDAGTARKAHWVRRPGDASARGLRHLGKPRRIPLPLIGAGLSRLSSQGQGYPDLRVTLTLNGSHNHFGRYSPHTAEGERPCMRTSSARTVPTRRAHKGAPG